MKIVIKLRKYDPVWEKYAELISKNHEAIIMYDNDLRGAEDARFMITTSFKSEMFEFFPNLKHVFLFKTGVDKLPLSEFEKRGIAVHPSHANSDIIAEHALSLSFALLHRTVEFHNDLSRGIWYADGKCFKWQSIGGLRAGILGFGGIGKCLHDKLKALCPNVTVLNRSRKYPPDINHADTLKELIKCSDIVFICLPLTDETVNMFDEKVFEEMQGKYIVNVGRAEICSEKALYNALVKRQIAGYASDVWYCEPDKTDKSKAVMPSEFPFWNLKNAVMSPHCATHEIYAHERYISDSLNACIAYADEEERNDSI